MIDFFFESFLRILGLKNYVETMKQYLEILY